jgi:NAD-dependent deacetylase
MDEQSAQVTRWIADASAVTVLTGAGISTGSGIPDFRGPQGLWTTHPEKQRLFTIQSYLADPDVRRTAWRERLDHPAWTARPGPGHVALVALERRGRLRAIATQNIDGLHQAAGNDPGLVLELHGTLHAAMCLGCGARTPMTEALARVRAGEEDPPCLACGGIQKSATVSFGQALDPQVLGAAFRAAEECDVFLAVGTSLTVTPAATLCDAAKAAGARLVVVNAEPTPYDGMADAVLRDQIGRVLPEILTTPTG